MFDESLLLFGIIPTTLLYPLGGFFILAYLVYGASGSLPAAGISFLTCITSYAILTAKGAHRYLSRIFQPPPRYIRLPLPFRSFLEYLHALDRQKNTKENSQKRTKR